MYKKSILSSRRTDRGLIEYEYYRGANKPNGKHHYHEIRGAVIWPAMGVDGCFVIVGQEHAQHDYNEVLELLLEFRLKELSLEKFFNRLNEATSLYRASPVYCDFDAPAFGPLQDFCARTNSKIDYVDSVHKDDFFVQLALTKDLVTRRKLIVPSDSEVWSELDRLDSKDLEDRFLERFALVAALASCVTGYSTHPPVKPIRLPGTPRISYGGPGWMRT